LTIAAAVAAAAAVSDKVVVVVEVEFVVVVVVVVVDIVSLGTMNHLTISVAQISLGGASWVAPTPT